MVILESASFVWLLISAYVLSIPYATRANGFLVILFAFGIYASVSNQPVIDSKVILAGLVIAATIFWIWLQRSGGSMEDTVHPAFVAGHLMVMGVNVMFFAFILHLAISERDLEGA